MIHNASELEFGRLATILMAIKEILKFSYKLDQGLGAIGHTSPSLIEFSYNKGRFSLGYEPTHEEYFQASRGKKRSATLQRCLFPISEPLSSSSQGHYA